DYFCGAWDGSLTAVLF
nr:immunoglobulin light chain junction region [Macaca mulatta]MOW36649.1 immunoglobulin light chain junction region [Macaca mulatta]MOW37858.1 immunoglobulin light chain junction region [Macaca mulatta]MOW37974.1 immunoglobulin light chain junction region [Macaca mulatta]MOW38079.1 immunoglobulin light chain junction region [Macaca mulatta]